MPQQYMSSGLIPTASASTSRRRHLNTVLGLLIEWHVATFNAMMQ